MGGMLEIAQQNLVSPMVLFFALGLFASFVKSDMSVPSAIAKTMALYLMMAIGFKGGVELAGSGLTMTLFAVLFAGAVLSALLPVIGFGLLRVTSGLSRVDAAAVAAHYGSISIVTFVAATQAVTSAGLDYDGYMIAVAAVMESPAIVVALLLAKRGNGASADTGQGAHIGREIFFNSSVLMLTGAFVIGYVTGKPGLETIAPFIVDPFRGVLCLFLLDMGLIAGRGLRSGLGKLSMPVLLYGLYMPLTGAVIGAGAVMLIGLPAGSAALLITLSASASYIAVPAALRLALPEATPSIYLTLSLGVTFPFNLAIGIPVYIWLAEVLT
ncbi:MAG: sodium-dependent bicarbonate transport family permease [Pseudomonadota bacterium]